MTISFLGLRLRFTTWTWRKALEVSISPAWSGWIPPDGKKRVWWGISMNIHKGTRHWILWDWNWFNRGPKYFQDWKPEVEE